MNNNVLQYECIFDQINVDLVSRRLSKPQTFLTSSERQSVMSIFICFFFFFVPPPFIFKHIWLQF